MDLNEIVNDESIEPLLSSRGQDEQAPASTSVGYRLPPVSTFDYNSRSSSMDSRSSLALDHRTSSMTRSTPSINEVLGTQAMQDMNIVRKSMVETGLAYLPLPSQSLGEDGPSATANVGVISPPGPPEHRSRLASIPRPQPTVEWKTWESLPESLDTFTRSPQPLVSDLNNMGTWLQGLLASSKEESRTPRSGWASGSILPPPGQKDVSRDTEDSFDTAYAPIKLSEPGEEPLTPDNHLDGSPKKKRRQRFDALSRKKVKAVRQCNETTPCRRCSRLPTAVCYRENLESIVAFRPGNSRMSQTRPQPGVFRVNWAADDQEILQARLRYPFSDVSNSPTLVIPCRKFVPDRKDILTEAWKGDENTQGGIGFPPYACCDQPLAETRLNSYLEECKMLLRERVLAVYRHEELLEMTYREAWRYSDANKDSLVGSALEIRMSSYLATVNFEMLNGNTQRLTNNHLPESRPFWLPETPAPPYLDYQLDTILALYLTIQQKRLLKQLKHKIFSRKREDWYEIYLTAFVLLSNLAMVYMNQKQYVSRHESTSHYDSVNFVSRCMSEEWEYSANNLLTHFRTVTLGYQPFTVGWEKLALTPGFESLDIESRRYLINVRKLLEQRHSHFLEIRGGEKNNIEPLTLVLGLILE